MRRKKKEHKETEKERRWIEWDLLFFFFFIINIVLYQTSNRYQTTPRSSTNDMELPATGFSAYLMQKERNLKRTLAGLKARGL